MNLCKCGCGREVDISKKTYKRKGLLRGQPNDFVRGHRITTIRLLEKRCACGAELRATKSSRQFCDDCLLARRKASDKTRQKARRLKSGHKEKYRAWFLKKTYGITAEEHAALFAQQGKCCAICGSKEPRTTRSWHVDHDHVTGAVRGILCNTCNLLLGRARDRVDILQGAIAYLNGAQAANRRRVGCAS
jgi:hypothetical protein